VRGQVALSAPDQELPAVLAVSAHRQIDIMR
jgi:hypothetical protein